MFLGALFQKKFHFVAQFRQPPVAFDQFLPDILVFAGFDQLADGFAQPLNRERDVVLDQFRAPNAEFTPGATIIAVAIAAAPLSSRPAVNFLAGGFDPRKKLVAFLQ